MPASNGAGATANEPTNETGQAGAAQAGGQTERLPELARRAERAFYDNVDRLRSRSQEARTRADEQIEAARAYIVERVNEKPFQTTAAVLGAGFLIGLLFAGRRR